MPEPETIDLSACRWTDDPLPKLVGPDGRVLALMLGIDADHIEAVSYRARYPKLVLREQGSVYVGIGGPTTARCDGRADAEKVVATACQPRTDEEVPTGKVGVRFVGSLDHLAPGVPAR